MSATTAEAYCARQVDGDTLQSLNLKTSNNLDEYVLVIIGIEKDRRLFENISWIINDSYIKWFNDIVTSLHFIESVCNKGIFVIISGSLGRDHAQKFTIQERILGLYVYCMEEGEHRMWTQGFNKIRCTVSNATELLRQLHRDVKELSGRWPLDEQSFQKATTSTSEWHHLFLLVICYRPEHTNESYQEMFNECRAYYWNNHRRIEQINQFQHTYKSDRAAYEYTRDSFVYRIINHALRTKNIGIVRKFSPFIRDLYAQLLECHRKYYKLNTEYIRAVYRGQHLSVNQLDYLRSVSKSNKPFITMTTFSSASLDPDIALNFTLPEDGRIPCLFEITIPDSYNRNQKDAPEYEQAFANIASLSDMPREQEVLFSLVTRFSVEHVGDPVHHANHSWVPIVLKLTDIENAKSRYSHYNIIKWIRNEKDPRIHNDVLDMLQVNAEDEVKSKSTNWQNWWNNLQRREGKGLGDKQPLDLVFYDCFTEDPYWSRKAIEIHKVLLVSIPVVQMNSSSFTALMREFNVWFSRPTIQIALYENYLKQFCTTDTEEVFKCLRFVGDAYRRIADKEHALECYQQASKINENDRYKMNKYLQKKKEMLQKSPRNVRTTNVDQERPVGTDSNKDRSPTYEAQRDLPLLNFVVKCDRVDEASAQERLRRIFHYIKRRENWYDETDAKIILRLPYEITEDLSVNDYRSGFLPAVHSHISSRDSTSKAANNHSLSLWRYEKYMHEWLICKELEGILEPFRCKSEFIRHRVLCHLQRLLKKLHVLITICTIYICIEPGKDDVNVDHLSFFHLRNPGMRHPICVDLRESLLLASLAAYDDGIFDADGTDHRIPDGKRLISTELLSDFM